MANGQFKPINDPTLIGYSKYSQFRVGNFISINGMHREAGIGIIGRILGFGHEEDLTLVEIENLSTGATAFVKPSSPGPFGALILFPENLGFFQSPESRHTYSDGIITLSGSGTYNYTVIDAETNRVVYDKKEIYDLLSECTRVQGIEFVHELQNLYADLFPQETLDLSGYIQRKLDQLVKTKRQIDAALDAR